MNSAAVLIFLAYVLILAFGYLLDYLNILSIKRSKGIPPEFTGQVDEEHLKKTRDYTVENTNFGIIASLLSSAAVLYFIFGGLLNIYNSWIVSLGLPFVFSGLVFFLALSLIETFLSIPLSLYHTFRIEKRYGFNTMTGGLWVKDFIKSLLISIVITSIASLAGLAIVSLSPGFWWLWLWCFFLGLSIFIMYISPCVMEPLFNKFEQISDIALEKSIRELMQKAGIQVSRVFKMDASRRTKHTNAYFTGIGKVKRIVLYDTLLERLDNNEIIGVLAHEVGHWKKKHLLKAIVFMEIIALMALYVFFTATKGEFLDQLFHINNGTFFSKAVVMVFIGSIIKFPFGPVITALSRKHEFEADEYSYKLTGDAGAMAGALVKLSRDNLSNLYPHPLYAAFHYTHPPVIARIRKIRSLKGG